ncbi:NERD domain-containing protein [Armatimonas rosea]|uniref:NERD domain-containing protein n=1 Tax=Armatimonas rosea TaxID=685828 RepID=A0A7W9W8S5_ARMRO|nr:NERD domain-containing protein [Armatimonas rosea]MBB6053884.1 hypothetical protein [Armatimonas rosea]
MPKLFPDPLPNRVRLDRLHHAEVRVYDALKSGLSAEWVVCYSAKWIGHRRFSGGANVDGETDFIVAHPDLGILLLEVKGGQIDYDGGIDTWTSTDIYGEVHEIDPVGQLRDAKGTLRKKLKDLPSWRGNAPWIVMEYAIVFPDCLLSRQNLTTDPTLSTPSNILIDGGQLGDIEKCLRRVFEHWRGDSPPPAPGSQAQVINALIAMLAPKVSLPNPMVLAIREEEQELLRLTEEQMRLLSFLSTHRRVAISGCAGSGKTMMAVEKARRLASEGFETRLLSYHVPLAQHLKRVTKGIPNLQALTLSELQADDIYEALVVDEGQDFTPKEWDQMLDCLLPDEGILYVFYDDNQRVRAHSELALPEGLSYFPLRENVRNTRAIHARIQPFYDASIQPRGPSGRTVEKIVAESPALIRSALSRTLHHLNITEKIPVADIVVLTPKSLNDSCIANQTLASGFKLMETTPAMEGRSSSTAHLEVRCESVASFKGLESPVVVVVEVDNDLLNSPQYEAICYVAFSRPRLHLVVIGSANALQQLMGDAV